MPGCVVHKSDRHLHGINPPPHIHTVVYGSRSALVFKGLQGDTELTLPVLEQDVAELSQGREKSAPFETSSLANQVLVMTEKGPETTSRCEL